MAQYSQVPIKDAIEIAKRYGLKIDRVEPLSGGAANSSVIISGVDGDFTLTVLDNHDKETAEILGRIQSYLSENEIPVPRVCMTPSGSVVTYYNDTPIMIKEFVHGDVLRPFPSEHLFQVGAILGRLHKLPIPEYIPSGTRIMRTDWKEVLADRDCPELYEMLQRANGSQDEWMGFESVLTHGDLFWDNTLIIEPNKVVILDWELAGNDPAVLDLGMSFVGMCQTENQLDSHKVNELLRGYLSERSLSEAELASLPVTTYYSAAVIALSRYVRMQITHVNPERADWYKDMIEIGDSVLESPTPFHDLPTPNTGPLL